MSKYIINGGKKLYGKVNINGAKNSVLPLLATCLLTDEPVIIHNCPEISDVRNMCKIIVNLGCKVTHQKDTIILDSSDMFCNEIPIDLAKELRSSLFLMGSLLTRCRKAKIAYPGGCDIGLRPIDIHLKALQELNIKIEEKYGYIYCSVDKIKGADIQLDIPSVGATENIMMAAVMAEGKTTVRNPAKEPEIVDLQNLLNKMGAKIKGAGSSIIEIEGVKKLHGGEHVPISDRISAGTYLIAGAVCGGEIEIDNVNPEHIFSLTSKLNKNSCKITSLNDKIIISSDGRLNSLGKVETMYYPGFPTDLQAQLMALSCVCKGTTKIVENIFETRFNHVPELIKMGADIVVEGRMAVVNGVDRLSGADVYAKDLRGGAALVIAALSAQGLTTVNDIYHIERGYENFEDNLAKLGAEIIKV